MLALLVSLLLPDLANGAHHRRLGPRPSAEVQSVLGSPPQRRIHARAAGDPGVSIVDFAFSPPTTTIHAGDTVTWINTGRQPHTATARDGTFDTGLLRHGQSASHTFTQPGSYTYFCTIHPFMHGTIVVLAAARSPAAPAPATTPAPPSPAAPVNSSAPASSPAPANGPAASDARRILPVTGIDTGGLLGVGLLLTGLGLLIRGRPRRSRHR
jgi:plastocyanin